MFPNSVLSHSVKKTCSSSSLWCILDDFSNFLIFLQNHIYNLSAGHEGQAEHQATDFKPVAEDDWRRVWL